PVAERLAQRPRLSRRERLQETLGDPIRQDGRVDADGRHLGAHETRDRCDRRGEPQQRKVDAPEAVGVVGVPEDRRCAWHADVQDGGGRDRGIGRLPVLKEKHRLPAFRRRRDDDIGEMRRYGAREVAPFTVLAVVDVARVIGAYPLRPSLQDEAPLGALLACRELRIADEQVVNEVAAIDQRVGQIDHARGETADERIAVGTLERDEHHVVHGRARIMARARMTPLQRIREDPEKVRDMLDAQAPRGAGEHDNKVIRQDVPPKRALAAKPHWEIGEQLGILDIPRGTKMSGSRFYVLRGAGAALQRALIAWMIDLKLPHGFTESYPPFLTRRETLIASSHLPHFAANQYHDELDDLWLIPTAEPQLVSLHRDEVLNGQRFPLRYVSDPACFPREQTSAGRDVRGIKRGHQF